MSDKDHENLETPITGTLPEPGPDAEDLENVGDAGDLPVPDPTATLGSSEETKPV